MSKTKIILIGIFTVLTLFLAYKIQTSNACTPGTTSCYQLLSPLPLGMGDDKSGIIEIGTTTNTLPLYINGLVKLFFGIISVLAVIMIVIGGLEYMTSGGPGEKKEGKDRIMNAIFGLMLALSSYLILNTINPDLVTLRVTIPDVTFTQLDDISQDPGDDGDDANTSAVTKKVSDGTYQIPPIGSITSDPSQMETITKDRLDPKGFGIFDNGVTVNKSVVNSIIKAFAEYENAVEAKPSLKSYRIQFTGGYFVRANRNNASKLSVHSYGLAIDINSQGGRNRNFSKKHPPEHPQAVTNTSPPTPPEYDLPQELITALKNNGWGWGGEWKHKVKDSMHFSKSTFEGGSGDGAVNI